MDLGPLYSLLEKGEPAQRGGVDPKVRKKRAQAIYQAAKKVKDRVQARILNAIAAAIEDGDPRLACTMFGKLSDEGRKALPRNLAVACGESNLRQRMYQLLEIEVVDLSREKKGPTREDKKETAFALAFLKKHGWNKEGGWTVKHVPGVSITIAIKATDPKSREYAGTMVEFAEMLFEALGMFPDAPESYGSGGYALTAYSYSYRDRGLDYKVYKSLGDEPPEQRRGVNKKWLSALMSKFPDPKDPRKHFPKPSTATDFVTFLGGGPKKSTPKA